jgi:ELWxxDGT repeat protein
MNITKLILLCLMLSSIATAQVTLYDINRSSKMSASSEPHFLTVFENRLCFLALDTAHGHELWCIDTLTGEFNVADINPAKQLPTYASVCANYGFKAAVVYVEALQKEALFYLFDDGVHGVELFRYDGVNTPVLIKEFIPGAAGLAAFCGSNLVAINDLLYFIDTGGIWQYNVNSGLAKHIPTNLSLPGNAQPRLFNFKNVLYVDYKDNSMTPRLYRYNQVADSLELVFSINDFWEARQFGSKLYFIANNILYEYDGVSSPATLAAAVHNTVLLKDGLGTYKNYLVFVGPDKDIYGYDTLKKKTTKLIVTSDVGISNLHAFIECMGKMYFSAFDTAHGQELWEWDGLNDPKLAYDFIPGNNNGTGDGYPYDFSRIGGSIYFIAISGEAYGGREPHRYSPALATVQNLSFKGEVHAYPNPVTSTSTLELQLHTAQTLSVELYNTEGKRIMASSQVLYSQGTSRVELDMRNLPSGNYFYHVRNRDSKTMVSGKLVKI